MKCPAPVRFKSAQYTNANWVWRCHYLKMAKVMVWTRIFLKAETNLLLMDLPRDPGKPQITGSAMNVSSQAFDRSQEISQGSLNHDELSSANVLFHADYALHQQEDPLRVGKPPMHNSSIFSGRHFSSQFIGWIGPVTANHAWLKNISWIEAILTWQ